MKPEEILRFIESYLVPTIQPDNTKMHHIDEAEWQSVKSRILAKVQKAQEDCPECKGGGKKWIVGDVSNCTIDCPACQDKVQKAAPDREKIAKLLYDTRYSIGQDDPWENAMSWHKKECYQFADQVIALQGSRTLFPSEEAIRKDEREKQINWFLKLIEDYGNVHIRKYEIRRIVEQALKGER